MFCQVVVRKGKVMISEKTPVSRQRRGMRRLEYEIFFTIYECAFSLCVCSPKHIYNSAAFCGKCADCCVGKFFPTLVLVRTCLMCPHRQGGIQQQHALFHPPCQVSVCRGRFSCVGLYFFEYVFERRRKSHSLCHRKTKPVSLPGFVIRVLTYDYNLDIIEGTMIECVENKISRGIANAACVFLAHKFHEICEIWLFEFIGNGFFPTVFYFYVHGCRYMGNLYCGQLRAVYFAVKVERENVGHSRYEVYHRHYFFVESGCVQLVLR